jgi:stage II sporulation protein D
MKIIKKIICLAVMFGLVVWPGCSASASKKDDLKSALFQEKKIEASLFDEQKKYEKQLEQAQKLKQETKRERQTIEDFLKTAKAQESEIQKNENALKAERNELARDVYILMKTDLTFYVLAGAENLARLLERNSYLNLVLDGKLKRIAEVDKELMAAAEKRKGLEEAKKKKNAELRALKKRERKLTNQIISNQNKLKESKNRQLLLERELLNIDTVGAKNERDFVFWNFAEGENFTIYGGGTEHGLGMSQYGAKGLASEGLSASTILGHYFQNTTVETRDTAGLNIKVEIDQYSTGRIYGREGSFSVKGLEIGAGGWVDVSDGYFSAFDASGKKVTSGSFDTLNINPSGGAIFEVTYKNSSYNKYRGSIQVVAGGPYTINVLPLEDYLKGVVPAEVNPSWPREAVKAQAIAARSYAVNHLGGELFDVDDTQQYQVYLGVLVEDWQSNEAISETAGQVVVYEGNIVTAYYHSTSGGWTENNELVWGGSARPYLRGVSSMQETDSPYWSWQTRQYSRAQLSQIFSQDERTDVGEIKLIKIENRGVSGRVIKITLVGSSGEKSVTGATFKEIFNKYSPGEETGMISTLFGIKAN